MRVNPSTDHRPTWDQVITDGERTVSTTVLVLAIMAAAIALLVSNWHVPDPRVAPTTTSTTAPANRIAYVAPTTTSTTVAPTTTTTAPPCQEDDPCWNCETMGNHVCGPVNVEFFPVGGNRQMVRVWDSHDHIVFGPVLLERVER